LPMHIFFLLLLLLFLSLAFVPWSRYSGVAHSSRLYWKSIPDEKGIRKSVAFEIIDFFLLPFFLKV
jgi:hypothetical protein